MEIDLRTPLICLGTWGWDPYFWPDFCFVEAKDALLFAVERGVTLIDTAPSYFDGKVEKYLGAIINDYSLAHKVNLATKVTPKVYVDGISNFASAQDAYPGAYIRYSLECSLRRLRMESVEYLQLHAWDPNWIGDGDWEQTLNDLKSEGKIKFWGVSLFDYQSHHGIPLAEKTTCDCIQVQFNFFDQSAKNELFDVCRKNNIIVIARSVLQHGDLTNSTFKQSSDLTDHEIKLNPVNALELIRTRRVLEAILSLNPVIPSIEEYAIRFAACFPEINYICLGCRNKNHVVANIDHLKKGPLLRQDFANLLKLTGW
jgi:aryl-alcohol dehydrogenase-like predicted oxidoreductase